MIIYFVPGEKNVLQVQNECQAEYFQLKSLMDNIDNRLRMTTRMDSSEVMVIHIQIDSL